MPTQARAWHPRHEANDLEDPSVEFISAEDSIGSYRLLREPANVTRGLRSAGLVPADAASRIVDSAGASTKRGHSGLSDKYNVPFSDAPFRMPRH